MMMTMAVVLIIGACAAGFIWLASHLKRQLREDVLQNQTQLIQMLRQQMETDRAQSTLDLETRRQSVETTVKGLKGELEKYQTLLKDFEQDRARKFGHLENELKNASDATRHLQDTTNRLNNILGNVKLRGQWGERMAEDVIRYTGLIEGVNYRKQQSTSSASRPDFTFYLPNDHKIHMDVKFPLDNYLLMVNSENADEKDRYEKEFFKNVRERIRELQGREYINPAEQTLDFVLLFIPNEQVYCLIQEKMPGLMDEALSQKVVLCSPFTLYAMLSIVRQAFENFRYEKDLKKIIADIELFAGYYAKFKERFEAVGVSIEKSQKAYDEIVSKSFKQLDTKIRHIEETKKGSKALDHETVSLPEPGEIETDDPVRS